MSEIGHTTGPHITEPAVLDRLPQPIVAMAKNFPDGSAIAPHSHRSAQLVYASEGVMTLSTAGGAFVVPPQRAVWVPAGIEHSIAIRGPLAMRTLYVKPDARDDLPTDCQVVAVSPLLRELILAATSLPQEYAPGDPAARLMDVILDQIETLPVAPLHLPMPRDGRTARIAEALHADPADPCSLAGWAVQVGASERTLARLFVQETGMSFGAWRQQMRLLKSLELLAGGAAVTATAMDVGYESPSAFVAMFRRALGVSPRRYFSNGRGRPKPGRF